MLPEDPRSPSPLTPRVKGRERRDVCVAFRRKKQSILKNKAAGLAVSAPVAHGGDPQDRAGKSLGATVRPEESKSRRAGAMLAKLLRRRKRQQKAPNSDARESRAVS